MNNKGIYIYGIVPNFYSPGMFRLLEHSGVYAIGFKNISAIVSDTDQLHLNFFDRESLGRLLVKHQKTLEEIQGLGFAMLIPMKLGTIAKSKSEVGKILSNGYDLIIETFKDIENNIEIDLVATWGDFSAALQAISNLPEIIESKLELLKKSPEPSQMDQIKLGMMVQAKLKEKNTGYKARILEFLSPECVNVKTHEVMNDEMILNAAFLINRYKQSVFEKRLEKIDEELDGLLNFKLVGPLPCYSFYTLEVKELNPIEVMKAKNELEISEETSEAKIKKAYFDKAKTFHPDSNHEDIDDENFNSIKRSYNSLIEYAVAARQSSKDELISLAEKKVNENLILVKIKD